MQQNRKKMAFGQRIWICDSKLINGFLQHSIDRYELLYSPPCLREINVRYEGENKVSVVTYWRSRDLFNDRISNIVGLLSVVMREVIIPNNCEIIQYIDTSRSLHIYKGDWKSAERVKQISINPQMSMC